MLSQSSQSQDSSLATPTPSENKMFLGTVASISTDGGSLWRCFQSRFGEDGSMVPRITFSKSVEILIFGIPEASGLRGSICLAKLVSTLLARAWYILYGGNVYQ